MKINISFFGILLCVVFLGFNVPVQAAQCVGCDSVSTCIAVSQACDDTKNFGKTFFSIRPQDSNSANRLVRLVNEDHSIQCDDFFAWGVDFTAGVQQSFTRNNRNPLAKWFLFNESDCVTVGIPNSVLSFDVDGRQLGLETADGLSGGIGNLCLNPRLQSIIGNINFWFDCNKLINGLWARTYFTVVRAQTKLGMSSVTRNVQKTGDYPDGDFTITCSGSPIENTSICQAFMGNHSFGNFPALNFGKYYGDSMSKVALSSVRFDIGYDAVKSLDGFFNCSACFLVPAGNAPQGNYLFEPIVGANKSWQLGAEFTGAYYGVYSSCNTDIDFYCDATITHLFKSSQTRTFALKNNGPGSQYLLLKIINECAGALLAGERAANIFSGQAKIGANVMFDGSMMFRFARTGGFFFDLGYNFWLRSKETISKTARLPNFAQNTYAIKGNEPLAEFNTSIEFCISDLATASKSTLAEPAPADVAPTFVTADDIDFNAALHPFACSNKLFAVLGYSSDLWHYNARINLSLEGEAEFGQKSRALNQWAVNINMGISI